MFFKKLVFSSVIIILVVICIAPPLLAGSENITAIKEAGETYLVEDIQRFESIKSPGVALALSGGGARALVNIGVIKALVEEKVPIDIIVGTSMGSIVGSLYGSGLAVEQIEDIFNRTPFYRLLDFNIGDSQSLLKTARVNQFIDNISPHKHLENFPIPTALLSYDLTEGNKYLITSGRISEVIQSSYAIPFYFPSYKRNNRFLIDPGIVEVSPAKAAAVLGGDLVIATTCFDELPYHTYNTPTKSAQRFISLIQRKNAKRILGNYADIVIRNDVDQYSFMDFNKAEELIKIGYKNTKRKMPEIRSLLKQKRIQLHFHSLRPVVDVEQDFINLKYDRILVERRDITPVFHYGKDYSFFNQDLIRTKKDKIQYGLEYCNHQLQLKGLYRNNKDNDIEIEGRWRQLSDDTDFIFKLNPFSDDSSHNYELGIKYYQYDFTVGLGRGKINSENYTYIDNTYNLDFRNGALKGETDLLFPFGESRFEILTSQQGVYEISSKWNIHPMIIYNNSEIMESPIIYRGQRPDPYVEAQFSLEWEYKYHFIDTIEVMKVFQLKDIGLYLFGDYHNQDNGHLAYGIGSRFSFDLLGFKPVDLNLYHAYDRKQKDHHLGLAFDYMF